MKFKILITGYIEVSGDEIAELREELGIEKEDDLREAIQQSLNDNMTDFGIDAGTTEIGAVEVARA